MVFFVVAASLAKNDDSTNQQLLNSSTSVNGRNAAQVYPVNVRIHTNLICIIGRQGKVQDWHLRFLDGAE
jgi:hypothetical protein